MKYDYIKPTALIQTSSFDGKPIVYIIAWLIYRDQGEVKVKMVEVHESKKTKEKALQYARDKFVEKIEDGKWEDKRILSFAIHPGVPDEYKDILKPYYE